MNESQSVTDIFGPVISSYSRAQALEDGVLVDVSSDAVKVGIRFPVALTIGAFGECVDLPDDYSGPESFEGRLHDLLFVLLCAIRANRGGDRVYFDLRVSGRLSHLWATCGPGDDGESVITVMLVGED